MQLLHYSICVAEIEIDHVEIVAHAVSLDTPVSNKKKDLFKSSCSPRHSLGLFLILFLTVVSRNLIISWKKSIAKL